MSEKSIVETMAASIGREAAVLKAKNVSAVAAAVVGEGS